MTFREGDLIRVTWRDHSYLAAVAFVSNDPSLPEGARDLLIIHGEPMAEILADYNIGRPDGWKTPLDLEDFILDSRQNTVPEGTPTNPVWSLSGKWEVETVPRTRTALFDVVDVMRVGRAEGAIPDPTRLDLLLDSDE